MTRSGSIKRGLAVSAIAALAVTGLPSSALADTINEQVGAGAVELFTPEATASTQNDGVNTTVHLLAGGGADVSQVRFEYGPANAPTTIATVSRTAGAFSTEWAPPAALFNTNVLVRAVGLNTVGTPVQGATDENTVTINPGAAAIDIANAPGSAVGVFRQLYGVEAEEGAANAPNPLPGAGVDHSTQQGIFTGTTSGAGAIQLLDLSRNTARAPLGNITPGEANAQGIRPFRGTANFKDYVLDATAPIVNEAVVGAVQTGGSEDAESVTLEQQTISGVTAVATPAQVPTGQTGTAVVTVTDAQGRPIAGAQVIGDLDRDGIWDGASNGGTEQSRYTDANGQATFANLPSSAAGTAYDFFVNVDGDDDFDAAKDFRRTVTIQSFNQAPTTLTAESADGAAFDTQEFANGDVTVQVNDQNGAGISGANVSYTWTFTPEPTTAVPAPTPVTSTGTVASDATGEADIPAPSNGFAGNGTYVLNAFIDNNGTPGQQAGEPSAQALTVTAGDSTLEFSDAPTATSVAGTTDTFEATLELFDGTPLAGRLVNFTYSPTGNSVVAAQANQPAGTTRNGDGSASATTNAQGAASVAISDPATPDQAELDNDLDASTGTNTIGNAAETATTLDVDFVDGTPPERTTVTVNAIADGKPGEAATGTVTVTEDADDNDATPETPVVGQAVTLTVDGDAFFTDGTYEDGTVGEDAELTNLGQEITVASGAGGVATFQTSIGRSEDFDDDGEATVTVTAAAGAFSDTEEQDFSSEDPLNGTEVTITELADQDNPTNPTEIGDAVEYDIDVTDGFGNPVSGETVDLEYSGPADGSNQNSGRPASITTEAGENTELILGAAEAGTVTVDATWDAPRFVYLTSTTVGTPAPPNNTEELTASVDAEFYEVDLAESTYTIDTNANGRVAVGTPVTTVVTAVDQEGNPIAGLDVAFLRSGPGDQQDGDPNDFVRTNANGQAFYTFVGTAQGTARISAVITDGTNNSEPVQTLSTSVTFGPDVPVVPPVRPQVRVTGGDRGQNDRVVVRTSPAASNAVVQLFRKGNGGLVRVAVKRATKAGFTAFIVRDRNGNQATRYIAKVGPTAKTTRARGFGNVR